MEHSLKLSTKKWLRRTHAGRESGVPVRLLTRRLNLPARGVAMIEAYSVDSQLAVLPFNRFFFEVSRKVSFGERKSVREHRSMY